MSEANFVKIHFEPRIEIRSDFSLVETFQDGSQLIRSKGRMVIVEATTAYISCCRVNANMTLFSKN